MSAKMFPIMGDAGRRLCLLPWEFIAPHEQQAKENHGGQTLDTLNRRGGLDPSEAVAVVGDRKWSHVHEDAALSILYRKLADFYLNRTRAASASPPEGEG